jgi:dsDNA-specific endonuclease/ATPase MutS2
VLVTSKTPHLDLHGEIEAMVEALIIEFINDNVKMRNDIIVIVHGKSTGILTKKTHEVLKNNKNVLEFKLDNWNIGQTIVKLKV